MSSLLLMLSGLNNASAKRWDFLSAKDLNASPGPEGSLEIARHSYHAFFERYVLPCKSLNRNLFWGFESFPQGSSH